MLTYQKIEKLAKVDLFSPNFRHNSALFFGCIKRSTYALGFAPQERRLCQAGIITRSLCNQFVRRDRGAIDRI